MSDIKTPYLNGHMYEFDLCWLVEKILSFESQLNQAIDLKTIHYADPIQWDITTQYAPNTVVVDPKTGTAYMSKVPVPAGILLTNADYWTVIFNYQDIYTKIMEGVAFYNGQTDYATKALLVNDLVWYGLDLYRVIKPIEEGGKLIPETNLVKVSIESLLSNYCGRDRTATLLNDTLNVSGDYTVNAGGIAETADNKIDKFTNYELDVTKSVFKTKNNMWNVEFPNYVVNLHDITSQPITPEQFGAVGNGIIDDTHAIQTAIQSLNDNGMLLFDTNKTYKVSTILVPQKITIDLNGSTLIGDITKPMFRTAIYTNNVLTENTANDHIRLLCIKNGHLKKAKIALQLKACIDSCEFSNLLIDECENAIDSEFSIYTVYSNIIARNGTNIGFKFYNNSNALTLKNLYAVGNNNTRWIKGFEFSEKNYCITLLNCSTEFVQTGITMEETHGLNIIGLYSEECPTVIYGTPNYAHRGVHISNCTAYQATTFISGYNFNEFYMDCTNEIGTAGISLKNQDTPPDYRYGGCNGLLELVSKYATDNIVPLTLPANYEIADGITVKFKQCNVHSYDSTPLAYAETYVTNDLYPMLATGAGGAYMSVSEHLLPFSAIGYTGTAGLWQIEVATSLKYSDFLMAIFRFDIQEYNGTYTLIGRVVGNNVFLDKNTSNLSCTVENTESKNGYLKLKIGNFTSVNLNAIVSGYIRHI